VIAVAMPDDSDLIIDPTIRQFVPDATLPFTLRDHGNTKPDECGWHEPDCLRFHDE
jgi:hypothetical protein